MLKSTGSSFGNRAASPEAEGEGAKPTMVDMKALEKVASPPTPKGQRASKGAKVVPLHDGPSESVADVQAKLNMLTAHNEELSGRHAGLEAGRGILVLQPALERTRTQLYSTVLGWMFAPPTSRAVL